MPDINKLYQRLGYATGKLDDAAKALDDAKQVLRAAEDALLAAQQAQDQAQAAWQEALEALGQADQPPNPDGFAVVPLPAPCKDVDAACLAWCEKYTNGSDGQLQLCCQYKACGTNV